MIVPYTHTCIHIYSNINERTVFELLITEKKNEDARRGSQKVSA